MYKIKQVLDLCRKHNSFLVTTHHNPDADAASSALSMAIFLKSLGKKVTVVNEDPLPEWLGFLPESKLFKKASDLKKVNYDVAIVLDCGDLERTGGVMKLLVPGRILVNIDHHVTNKGFGDISLIKTDASSTCEIVFQFLKVAGFEFNKAVAVLLYAGIMTDTGSFRFENTSGFTHSVIAKLMSYGVDASDLYNRLYVGIPVNDMKVFTEIIHQAQLLLDNKVYCVALPNKTIVKLSKSFDLKEKLFSFLRTVEGIEVVVILTELSPKETRVNLRSQGDFNVSSLAQEFNGGGHVKAAGAKVFDNLDVAQKVILAAIKKRLLESKRGK